MHSSTSLFTPQLKPLRIPPPKRYKVICSTWLTETNGELVESKLNYGEYDTLEEAQEKLESLKEVPPEWNINGVDVHPYFGTAKLNYRIEDTKPSDQDIVEAFPEWDFNVPEQNKLPAKALVASTSLGGQQ